MAKAKGERKPRQRVRRIVYFLLFLVLGISGWAAGYYAIHGTFAPLAVSIATHVLPLIGDRLPTLPSPFGSLRVSSKQVKDGRFVEFSCEPCRLSSQKIAPEPFTLGKGKASGVFSGGKFNGDLEASTVRVKVSGDWEKDSFRGNFELPPTEIKVLYSIASSIVPETRFAKIEGTVTGKGTFQWPQAFVRWRPKISKFKVTELIDLEKYQKGVFTYPAKNSADDPIVLESGEGTESWTAWEALGPYLPQAVIAAEDGTFYQHPGYDVPSMDEALKENEQLRKIRRGASTLTQQLAKNLFLSPERSYSRKLRELLYAVNLELLGKKRILELYLNICELGPDIRGAKQAAGRYFGKAPKDLLPEEAAWLAAILRSPKRSYQREFMAKRPNVQRVIKILLRMKELPLIEKEKAVERAPQLWSKGL